jgi:hypothetical protein
LFNDSDLKIVKSSWSDTGQMFLVVLARRRKLSIQKWKAKLNAQDIQPRIILYDATLYEALTNEYECHWP